MRPLMPQTMACVSTVKSGKEPNGLISGNVLMACVFPQPCIASTAPTRCGTLDRRSRKQRPTMLQREPFDAPERVIEVHRPVKGERRIVTRAIVDADRRDIHRLKRQWRAILGKKPA